MGALVQFRAANQKEETADSTLLTAVMEASAESLAIVENGQLLRANRAFARTFGYVEGAELEANALADFIPESVFLFSSEAARPVVSPAEMSVFRCEGLRKGGEEMQLLVARAVVRNNSREFTMLNLRRLDEVVPAERADPGGQIEDRKSELQKLESQRLEAIGRVVASVAHDFNNLLTGVLLYCDLLIRGIEPGSPLQGYVEEIRKAGHHSSGLIQQLLTAAQPQAADTDTDTGAYRWNDVIAGMQKFLARMLGEDIELTMELDPRTAAVRVSETAMRQIAMNLLLNSRDAMPGGGRITLACRNCVDGADTPSELLDGYVEFIVKDSGCGMDAATRARVFEPFFTTKGAGKGNGLGLATVQRIVSDATGSLEVQSEPGQGTRIAVRLPQAHAVELPSHESRCIEDQIRSQISSPGAQPEEPVPPRSQISA